jgi:hypothetical protein
LIPKSTSTLLHRKLQCPLSRRRHNQPQKFCPNLNPIARLKSQKRNEANTARGQTDGKPTRKKDGWYLATHLFILVNENIC